MKKKVKVAQLCLTLCDPMDYTVRGILQTRILEWVAFPFSRGSSQPSNHTQVFCIAGGFFTSWATREAPNSADQNTGVCSLSLLQPIFLTQELNLGLLHCKRILYHLSYQGSPHYLFKDLIFKYNYILSVKASTYECGEWGVGGHILPIT